MSRRRGIEGRSPVESSGDAGFALEQFGDYELYAMMLQVPLTDEQLRFARTAGGLGDTDLWTGRAVSEPVPAEIRAIPDERLDGRLNPIAGRILSIPSPQWPNLLHFFFRRQVSYG